MVSRCQSLSYLDILTLLLRVRTAQKASTEGLTVQTFHSCALSLVKENCHAAGLPTDPFVLDGSAHSELLKECIETLNLNPSELERCASKQADMAEDAALVTAQSWLLSVWNWTSLVICDQPY